MRALDGSRERPLQLLGEVRLHALSRRAFCPFAMLEKLRGGSFFVFVSDIMRRFMNIFERSECKRRNTKPHCLTVGYTERLDSGRPFCAIIKIGRQYHISQISKDVL